MSSLFRVALLFAFAAYAYGEDGCPKLKPATGLEVEQVLGTWYAVRGLEHSLQPNNTSPKKTKSCPVIKIISKGQDVIEFQWNSKDKPQKKIELKVNKEKPGFLEYNSKKGSSAKGSFRNLQISVKGEMRQAIAVTMCKAGGRIASVIISREPTHSEGEVKALTAVLAEQGLSTSNVYDRCIKE